MKLRACTMKVDQCKGGGVGGEGGLKYDGAMDRISNTLYVRVWEGSEVVGWCIG